MDKEFCRNCSKRESCVEICDRLEKYLRKFTTYRKEPLSLYQDNAERAIEKYDWAGGQDADFINANLGWD